MLIPNSKSFPYPAIPKIIHYVWFGKGISGINTYVKTWKKFNPDFKLVLWNEKNVSLHNAYLKNAYKLGNFANIANYVRLEKVYKYGGIYLDTDIKVLKPLHSFLYDRCFFCLQLNEMGQESVNNAVFGSVKKHWFIREQLETMLGVFDGSEFANFSSPLMTTTLLKKYGLRKIKDTKSYVRDIAIYPVKYFYPLDVNARRNSKANIYPSTHTVHYWKKRWS